jgi:spore coat protein U-like protein
MRTLSLALATLTLFAAFAGNALADTQDLVVSAQVVGTCRFDSASDIDFGTLDQTATTDETATGNLVFWCTKNANYALTDEANPTIDGSFSGTLVGTNDSIPYDLTYTNFSGSGAGKTSPITSVVTATIINADYVDVEADTYSDTVTFTVTP